MDLIKHFEAKIGQMVSGKKYKTPSGEILMGRFDNSPSIGYATFATIGFSKEIGFELLCFAKDSQSERCADNLATLARLLQKTKKEIGFRSLVGPFDEIPDAPGKSAFYLTAPGCHNEGLSPSADGVNTLWALPVTSGEASFIETFGGASFEDILEETEEDVADLDRKEINLAPHA